jgi:hypothetical protein
MYCKFFPLTTFVLFLLLCCPLGALSSGGIAGAAIGAVAGVCLIAAGLWFFVMPSLVKAPLAAAAEKAVGIEIEMGAVPG